MVVSLRVDGKKHPSSYNQKSVLQQRGSAMVEFALVLPLYLVLLTWLVEFGNMFSYVGWVAQASYNTVVAGGKTSQVSRSSVMAQELEKLIGLHARHESLTYHDTNESLLAQDSVALRLDGVTTPLLHNIALPFHLELIGPIPLLETDGDIGSLVQFENPRNGYYHCDREFHDGSSGENAFCNWS